MQRENVILKEMRPAKFNFGHGTIELPPTLNAIRYNMNLTPASASMMGPVGKPKPRQAISGSGIQSGYKGRGIKASGGGIKASGSGIKAAGKLPKMNKKLMRRLLAKLGAGINNAGQHYGRGIRAPK
jgi:hypothetical protein